MTMPAPRPPPPAAPRGLKPPPVVEFRKVSVRFGAFTAVQDITFAIDDVPEKGEFITLVGPSGCGKSTILNMIAGLLKQTEGDVLVGGLPVEGPGRDRGMIFQQYSSFPHLTVLNNVLFGLEINAGELGMDAGARRDRAMQFVEHVGLRDHHHKYPHQLSGGQQQRVAIARSLAVMPRILLMDEPFSALDEPTRLEMQELIVALWHKVHPTVFCVTHSITEAVYLGERVWVMAAGPGQIVVDIRENIPPTVGVPPLVAQERQDFKDAVRVVTETFRKVSEKQFPAVR